MTLAELIKKKNVRLETVPDKLLNGVEQIQKTFYTEILALLDRLQRTDGNILATADNFQLVPSIIDDLKQIMGESDYVEAVKTFAAEFQTQKKFNDDYFEKAFTEFTPVDLAEAIVKKAEATALDALLGEPLTANFLNPLENILTNSVSSGAGWKETLTAIQDFAIGDNERDGKLLQYSKQIAHDTFAISDRSYTNAIADDLESEWFLYSGGELPTSRCFCIERHEKYFHWKEIQAWGRGENLGDCRSGDLWAGANPATNESTIFIYAGGFSCIHSILPVAVFSVPREVIDRNLANGNYQPTDAELALIEE